ncbi:MAG: response regulator [Candidatus Solibacter usitatus]|nr:response regulator [Candidatus Solibacter usitatus]
METIVVAEDDPSSRELVCEILEAQGYHVVAACNGREALDQIEKIAPDLLVMDIQMPLIGGLVAIERIRQDARFAKLRVLAVTAHAMAGDRERILSSGFDGYVSKPIDAVIFKKSVRDLLQARIPLRN